MQKKYNIEKLVFSEDFFKGEIKEGFYVEEMMKRAWAAELEILYIIDDICQRHNITYFADWGTLLGAIRHKGFIPWDDDIDITMKREDHNRFIEIAKKELPERFVLLGPQTNGGGYKLGTLVGNTMHYITDKEYLDRFHGFPLGAGVDTFPLDGIPDCAEEREFVENAILILSTMCGEEINNEKGYWDEVAKIEQLLNVTFDRDKDISLQMIQMADKIAGLYGTEECDYITAYATYLPDRKWFFKKEWYSEVVYMPFENMMIPVPKEYDKILKVMYGDYMTPVRGTQDHDYPFYKEQLRLLSECCKEQK